MEQLNAIQLLLDALQNWLVIQMVKGENNVYWKEYELCGWKNLWMLQGLNVCVAYRYISHFSRNQEKR